MVVRPISATCEAVAGVVELIELVRQGQHRITIRSKRCVHRSDQLIGGHREATVGRRGVEQRGNRGA
jgi:hypothetical protein